MKIIHHIIYTNFIDGKPDGCETTFNFMKCGLKLDPATVSHKISIKYIFVNKIID